MSLEPNAGYAAGVQDDDTALPIFDVQQVHLRFEIAADFVAAQVANNVLILALSTGRILRFDLERPEDIDDIDLAKRPADIGSIRKLFLDPTASHLIISTALGENFYLHTQSRTPKPLARIKGVRVESVAWNPSRPVSSTREILIGDLDGNVYETYIEPNTEFYKNQEKYVKNVYNPQDGPIVGLYTDVLSGQPEVRRVIVATQHKLVHVAGKTGGRGHDSSATLYSRLFDGEASTVHEVDRNAGVSPSCLAISPDSLDPSDANIEPNDIERAYAWLTSQGILTGRLLRSAADSVMLGKQIFKESKTITQSTLPPIQSTTGRERASQPPIASLILTQFHAVALVGGTITAVNRLDESVIYSQQVLDEGKPVLGLFTDHKANTYWAVTAQDIYEIVVTDETRHVWGILLRQGDFQAAQKYAKTPEQKDAVASATGDHLMSRGKFDEAAAVLGRSSKAFEDVALQFIDKDQRDALRSYLLVKLSTLAKNQTMQRIMLSSWLVELYMSKLNQLDDTISTKAELTANGSATTSSDTQRKLPVVRKEFQDFVIRNKADIDRKTIYEIISAHGREEELLFFANVVEDYNYVLSYWIQRERWAEAMNVLKKQTEADMFYRYSAVLMAHIDVELVEVLMRQSGLDEKKIIPALLNYNKIKGESVSLDQNQAIRYLQFCITRSQTTEPAIHNTLISMYAAHPTTDETALLKYLRAQDEFHQQYYDADFALRLCITHKRVRSAVHVYCTMQQYASAVELALKHDEIELAATVADQPGIDDVLRKKLWLKVAKKVIEQSNGIKVAIEFLRRCQLLRIEDLIPFFPDFVVIDDFKEEICAALEEYSRQIDELKREMDESAKTAQHIKQDIKALDERYAIVEPGERCWKCRLPLLMRQFFVFPCQHSFHADCLGEMVMSMAGMTQSKRIRELQKEIGRGVALGKRREMMVKELDGLVAGACVLCSEVAVKQIDEPFVRAGEDRREWTI